jgi:hypothetical protein
LEEIDEQDEAAVKNKDILRGDKKKQLNGAGKRAWWWKHFTIKTLTTKFDKGKGKKKESVFNKEYTCSLCKNFARKASKLRGATSALSQYIKGFYKRKEDSSSDLIKQAGLDKFVLVKKKAIPEFKEAVIDWIVETC